MCQGWGPPPGMDLHVTSGRTTVWAVSGWQPLGLGAFRHLVPGAQRRGGRCGGRSPEQESQGWPPLPLTGGRWALQTAWAAAASWARHPSLLLSLLVCKAGLLVGFLSGPGPRAPRAGAGARLHSVTLSVSLSCFSSLGRRLLGPTVTACSRKAQLQQP